MLSTVETEATGIVCPSLAPPTTVSENAASSKAVEASSSENVTSNDENAELKTPVGAAWTSGATLSGASDTTTENDSTSTSDGEPLSATNTPKSIGPSRSVA